jgi:hypothetical protein
LSFFPARGLTNQEVKIMRQNKLIVPAFGVAVAGAAAVVGLSSIALAQVPTYTTFELQVRSNLCVNESPNVFNLPCDHFFTSGTPTLNDAGQAAIRLNVMGGSDSMGLWFGAAGSGSISYTSPAGALVSDADMNNLGYTVFPQTFSSLNGVYFYDHDTDTSGIRTNAPIGASVWGSPQVNDSGDVGYRAGFGGGGQAYFSIDVNNSQAFHATNQSADSSSPYTFLFTPSMNNLRQIAGKVRLSGSGAPDQIRIFNTDGSSTFIVETSALDPNSPFSGFDNSVSLNDNGYVAFTATLVAGGRGVFLSNGSETIEIATTAHPDINSIEFFSPVANNSGLVAFRVRDGQNLYAIFVGDGNELRRLIGQFDKVQTDLGPGQIAQHDSSPTFGGSVAINNHGDIAFNAALTPIDDTQVEWGSGVFIAYADADDCAPADLNCDGVVDVSDLLILFDNWGECADCDDCDADLNDDCAVDVSDLLILFDNWG